LKTKVEAETDANTALAHELQELMDTNNALEAKVEEMTNANVKLNAELPPLKESNAELLDTVDKLTLTLNESKSRFHNEVKELNEKLETEKAATAQIAALHASLESNLESAQESHKEEKAQMLEEHKAALSKISEEMSEKHEATVSKMSDEHDNAIAKLKKKADSLHAQLDEEQAATLKIAERHAITESKLCKAEKKLADRDQLKKELADMRKLLEEEKKITGQIKELQARLEETEEHLSAMTKNKEDLAEKLGQVEGLNDTLKTRLDETEERLSDMTKSKAEMKDKWSEDKSKLKKRIRESEKTLVMVAEEKERVKQSREESEKQVSELQAQLETTNGEKDALEKKIKDDDEKLVKLEAQHKEEIDLLKTQVSEKIEEVEEKFMEEQALVIVTKKENKELLSRLDDAEKALDDTNSEKENLQLTLGELTQANNDLITELGDSQKLSHGLSAEKKKMIEEKLKVKKRLRESETTLVAVANQKTILETQKADLERRLLEGNNKAIADLQVRLSETEHALACVKLEKDKLQISVIDLEHTNRELHQDINDSRSLSSQSMISEENIDLKKRLRNSEKTLVMVADQNDALAKQKAELEKKLNESKKEMMDRQHSLEEMLKEALVGNVEDKENSKKRLPKRPTPKKILSLDMKSARPPVNLAARTRNPSRSRQPLSPAGSITHHLAPMSPPKERDSSALRRRSIDP